MESENRIDSNRKISRKKMIAIALIPLIVLAGMLVFLFGPGMSILNIGIPLPEITIEKIEFQNNKVIAYIRNTGPEEIEVAQADINDRIIPAAIEPSKSLSRLAEAKVIVPFPWNAGVPYEVGVTISDGTRFSKSVEAAALAPTPNIAGAFNGQVLIAMITIISFLVLLYTSEKLVERAKLKSVANISKSSLLPSFTKDPQKQQQRQQQQQQ